ncbi:PilZ domain-containing protein [Curvivirga aplysinae]|uniref:PilZ domain-containing protein n=1 Tax=Curvivirga aplysinae TaxID=2529852 RepID=UPI0012BC1E34|nr:PilZ domain-containing protein [Curvivirga aplysinae]MTI10010.1 hypothetical protein [Curvivirga aplysinae]
MLFLNNLFKNEKRYDVRIYLDGTKVFLNKKQYYLMDLSHSGFAIEGKLRPETIDQVMNVDFTFFLANREMMVSCRAKLIWHRQDKAGFEFFELTHRETKDLAYFIKSHQYQVAAE